MALNDSELELLEAHLDGALPPVEVGAVRQRLETDAEFREALQVLRDERAARGLFFEACEPTQASVDRLIESVQRKVDSQWRWSSWFSRLRPLTAAAACILIGIMMGRVHRSNDVTTVRVGDQPMQVASGAPVRAAVDIRDQSGRVIATQVFDSVEKANQFINDMRTWQERQEQINNGNVPPPAVPVQAGF